MRAKKIVGRKDLAEKRKGKKKTSGEVERRKSLPEVDER